MVKSTPIPNGSVVIRTRRGVNGGLAVITLMVLVIALVMLLGAALFAPANLALAQEQTLALLNGGVAARQEETFVDACVQVAGAEQPQAITRTRRTVIFANGTQLDVTFSGRPAATTAC